MGFLDSLLEGKKNEETATESGTPFKVSITFAPVRLSAMSASSIRMIVRINNLTKNEQMLSLDVLLSKNGLIGFEPACITKHQEKKLGNVGPGETTEVVIQIYGTNQTKEGAYPYKAIVYSHYLDYDKIISKVEKKGEIRVV